MSVLYCLMYGTLNKNGELIVKKITNFFHKKISGFFTRYFRFSYKILAILCYMRLAIHRKV